MVFVRDALRMRMGATVTLEFQGIPEPQAQGSRTVANNNMNYLGTWLA